MSKYHIPKSEFFLLLEELGERVGHFNFDYQFNLNELRKVFKETDWLPNDLTDKELKPILNRINNCW